MKSSLKIVIFSGILALIAVVPSFLQAQTTAMVCTDIVDNLKLGWHDTSPTGPAYQLQNFLRAAGFFSAQTTGKFGPLTRRAVIRFQIAHGLPGVGRLGPRTRALIKSLSCSQTNAVQNNNTQTALAFTPLTNVPPLPTIPAGNGPYADGIPVLLYHGEGNLEGTTPIDVFTAQMQALHDAGWQTITMEQFHDFMKNGAKLPAKSFLLTFDDGRKDTFFPVDPVLKQFNYTAVMFVITGFSMPDNGSDPHFYANKNELAQMVMDGHWELESHSKEAHRWYTIATNLDGATTTAIDTTGLTTATSTPGHFLSNKFVVIDPATGQPRFETDAEYTARVTNDLTAAKNTLESNFGRPVTAFAFPFNDFGPDTVNFPGSAQLLAQIVPGIYDFAFYQVTPGDQDFLNYSNPNQFMIKRVEPQPTWSGADLVNTLSVSLPKALPYQNNSLSVSDWLGDWGSVTQTKDNTLLLQATASTTGAEALLNGSKGWTDYTFSADVIDQPFSDVTLIARYQDSNNYLTCSFSGQYVALGGKINGVQKTFASTSLKDVPLQAGEKDLNVGITVKGNTASCSEIGTDNVSYTFADNSEPAFGQIGISTWNATPGQAEIELRNVSVQPQ